MDRSDVSNYKETHLRQSYVFNTGVNVSNNLNRSIINTALVNDSLGYGDDSQKSSRIPNLPNYKRSNLGENLQFIIVFQTIEIQRLSSEIQILRAKLKQNQRMLFNAQNYEVQIRELTERCFAMEKEREEYRQQMENLNKISQTLYHENQMLKSRLSEIDISLKQKFESQKSKNAELMQQIEKWKSRYQASQKSKGKELEDLRNLMDCQRKSMIDREIRQMTIRFQNQRSSLENQIRKSRQLLENRNRELNDCKQKIQKLDIQVMELRNYENILAETENKIAMVSQQMMRLNQILKDKEDEIHNLRQRQQRLNQQIKQQGEWENQNKKIKSLLQTRNKQIEDWKVRNSRLQDQVVRAKQLNHYVEQLQNKVNLTSNQIQRLNGVLRSKMDEIQQWKKRVSDKQMELSKLKNLEYEIDGYKTKMSNSKIQNDRINGILKSRLGQIEQWKDKYGKIENKLNQYSYIEKDKRSIQQKFNNQIKANQEMKFHISKLEQEIQNFRRQQNQFKQIERQNLGLSKQIQRLNNVLRVNNNEMNDYKTRYNKIQSSLSEYKNIETKVKDFEHKIIIQTQESERLNQLINEKNGYINNLEKEQIDLHSKINHYKSYESKIQQSESYIKRYQDQIDRIKRELDGWQLKCKEAQTKAERIEGELFKNVQQKDRVSNMLKTKNSEFQNLRGNFASYEAEARKVGQLEAACEELNNHIMGLVGDIQGYERINKQIQSDLEKQKQITNEFAFKVIILSAEVQRLSKEGGSGGVKSKQFIEIQQSHERLKLKVQSKNNQIDMLQSKIATLENKNSNLTIQFNKLLDQAQKSERQTQSLVRRIQEYQDYARRIHILGNEIDQLNKEKHNLQDEVKMIRLRYADNINSEQKHNAYLIKFVMMAAQIQTLRGRMQQREVTGEQMRKSILESVRRI